MAMPPPKALIRSRFRSGHGFAVIEEPVQAFEGHIAVYFLKHIQKARDAFVIGGVQTKWPFVGGQQRDHPFEFAFEGCRQVRARLQEIFKVSGGKNQHFTRAIAAEKVITFAGSGHLDPAGEIFLLLFWLLREKIVRNAEGHLAAGDAVPR